MCLNCQQNAGLVVLFSNRMVKLRKYIQILAVLLIPVYLLVMGNSILNRHTHVLPNGIVITHSHPFTDSKTGLPVKHSHTPNQVLFYQLFTFDFFQSSPEVFLSISDSPVEREIESLCADQFSVGRISTSFLRGPPVG